MLRGKGRERWGGSMDLSLSACVSVWINVKYSSKSSYASDSRIHPTAPTSRKDKARLYKLTEK